MSNKKAINTFDDIINQMKKCNTCLVATEKGIHYVGDYNDVVLLYDQLTSGIVNIGPSIETYTMWRDYFKQLTGLFDEHIDKLNKKNEEGVKDEL